MYTLCQLLSLSLFTSFGWGEVYLHRRSENMSFLLSIVCLVTLTGLALGGISTNVFIIVVIVIEWAKCRTLNSNEMLLLSLAMSNNCCTASVMAIAYWEHLKSNFRNHLMHHVINIFFSIAMLSRFWLNAWLCVFYCVKIVNSTQSLLLWCKQRISWLLPWILVASAIISILSSAFAFQLVPVHLQNNTTTVNITEMGQEEFKIIVLPSYEIFFFVIGSCCPLLVVLLCSILTVASLYRHVCQMTGKESNFKNPQTEAHFKAARTVLFLLFLYLSSFIAQILVLKTKAEENISFWLCAMVIMGYSFAQAVILVLVNPRLNKAFTMIFPGRKL